MKKNHFAIGTAALLLATGAAQAQVNIYISGATAFRDSAYRAIRGLYGANLASQNPAPPAGSPEGTALLVTFTGTIPSLFGAQTVNVYANWNGAVAGVQNLTQDSLVQFLSSATAGDTNRFTSQVDLGFSSVYQASTLYTSPVLNDTKFGVTPVVWVKSTNSPAGLTNITFQQVKALVANGALPGSFLDGNPADTNLVYFVNRDTTAGQRVIILRDSGYTGTPHSYVWSTNSNSFVVDPTGQSSASVIASQLRQFGPALGYLTLVDAINVNGGANIITYNGNYPFNGTFNGTTNDFSPVINGQYGLWGYEHILSRSTASQNVNSFRDALITQIAGVLSSNAFSIPITSARVSRNADGGVVTPQ